MKKLPLLALAALALPSLALAKTEKEGFDLLKSNPNFLRTYMQCGPMRASGKKKTPEKQTCEEKNALKHCDWADKLPQDIQKKVELDLACDFMAGELKGDNSEHDTAVIKSIELAGCTEAAGNAIALLRSYWGKQEEMRAILFFASEFSEADMACYKEKKEANKEKPKEEVLKIEEPKTDAPKAEEVKTEEVKPAPSDTLATKTETPKVEEPKKEEQQPAQ